MKKTILENLIVSEIANTFGADLNEILMGYYLGGASWNSFGNGPEAKKAVDERKKMVDAQTLKDQTERAKVMAKEVLSWAKANGYEESVQKVWWTARPGILAKAVGREVDSRKNPTDILIDFGNGKFLGVSAKSTKGSGDIGFKNPGLGTISKSLGIDFEKGYGKIEADALKKLKLPEGIKLRKIFIRENPKIQEKTIQVGIKILAVLRDTLLKKLESLDQNSLRKHLLSSWLDAEGADPYYIKVTGRGTAGKYSADVFDPIKNEKFQLITNGELKVLSVGNESIGVLADGHKIMKMRFKYESEKLASSIKLSGDPY